MFGYLKIHRLELSLLLIALISNAFLVWTPLTDTDIWWHLAHGRELSQSGKWIHTDIFSYTPMRFETWHNAHWLFQVFVFKIYEIANIYGLVLFKVFLWSLTVVLSFFVGGFKAKEILIYSSLLSFLIRYEIMERPTLFSYFFFILFATLLFKEKIKVNKNLRLFLIFSVTLIWIQIQGLWVLGSFLILLHLANNFSKNKASFFSHFSAVIISLIFHPSGFYLLNYPLGLLQRLLPIPHNVFSASISENIPLHLWYNHEKGMLVFVFILISIVIFIRFKENSATINIVSMALLLLSAMALRNLPFLFLWIPFIGFQFKATNYLKSLFPILFLSICMAQARDLIYQPNLFLSPYRIPTEEANLIKSIKCPGNWYHSDRHGGYLAWINPQSRIMLDGRFFIKDKAFFNEYLLTWQGRDYFDKWQKKWNISKIIIPKGYNGIYEPLYHYLNQSKQLKKVVDTKENSIFLAKHCKEKI